MHASIFVRLLSIAALGLIATAAWPQGTPFETTQRIETAFADVETLRMRGDCAARARKLSDLAGYLVPFIAGGDTGFSAAAKAEYRERLSEATLRPCPPRRDPPPPAVTPPLPATVTLDDLSAEYLAACGAAFEPARARYVAALDRAITRERDPARRARLAALRSGALAASYRSCNPQPATGPAPRDEIAGLAGELEAACGDQWSVLRLRLLGALDRAIAVEGNAQRVRDFESARKVLLRRDPPPCVQPAAPAGESIRQFHRRQRWQTAAGDFERELFQAERARFAGTCAARAQRLAAARAALARMGKSGYVPPTPGTHAARLREQERRACPPPGAAAGAKPPTLPAPTPRTAAARRPARAPDCENVFESQARSGRGMTCRCNGIEQFLMTWGSNPYRGGSAICNAAIHAGVLPANGVGVVTIQRVAGAKAALGSERNGISTYNMDFGYESAFTFVPVDQTGAAPPR